MTTVAQYLATVPADRRAALSAVRDAINANLPDGFEEGIQYGMISWYVPTAKLAKTYNGQPFAIASLGNQKNYMALYLMSVYGSSALNKWFVGAYKKTGKKLDMGKACIRFKKLDDLPLDVIGEAIRRVPASKYIAFCEAARPEPAKRTAAKPTAGPRLANKKRPG